MISPSEARLKELWLKACAASDPTEVESLIGEFRDALHQRIDQMKEQAEKRLPEGIKRVS